MTMISDQKLKEFISGGLPEAEAQEIEDMLNNDPALCERVAKMSSTDTTELANTVKAAVDCTAQGDVPTKIIDMLRSPETVVPFNSDKDTSASLRKYFQLTAVAASVAIAAIASIILLQPNATDALLPSHTVTALNSMVDGAQNGTTIVGESFLSANGQFCRSFKLDSSAKQVGLACKSDANWQLIALVTIPTDAVYFPAGTGADGLLDQYTASMQALNMGGEIPYLTK